MKQKRKKYIVQPRMQYEDAVINLTNYFEKKGIEYEYLNHINTFIIEADSSTIRIVKELNWVNIVVENEEPEVANSYEGKSVKKKSKMK